MSRKISIVTTSFNAYTHDISALEKSAKDRGFLFETVLVTAFEHTGRPVSVCGTEYKEVFPPERLGYYDCLRFGMLQSTGDYIYFLSANSRINDSAFIADAASLLQEGSDMVFARSEITSVYGQYVMRHPFESKYSPVEFLKEWHNLRMVFVDYFGFSSILFKKDLLMSAEAFISKFPDSLSQDTATLIKYVLLAKEIHFLESVACTRNGPGQDTEESDKSNITQQVINHFAIPLDVYDFIRKKNIAGSILNEIKIFFNQYALYSFNAITSDYHQTYNDLVFSGLELDKKLKNKKIFIYGHGWVGLDLNLFLNKQGMGVSGFIDDFKTGDGILSFEKFLETEPENTAVIIASYKCSDVFHIYKKLLKINNLQVIDLL